MVDPVGKISARVNLIGQTWGNLIGQAEESGIPCESVGKKNQPGKFNKPDMVEQIFPPILVKFQLGQI